MDDRECRDLKIICDFFITKPLVTFAYRFCPLKNSGFEPMVKYEIAFHIGKYLSTDELVELHRQYLQNVIRLLSTRNLLLIPINACPLSYQRIIYQTGIVIYEKDANALEFFQNLHQQIVSL